MKMDRVIWNLFVVLSLVVSVLFVVFPYWISGLLMIAFGGVFPPVMGIRAYLYDKTISGFRRYSFLVLGCAFAVGAVLMLMKLSQKIQAEGWFGKMDF